MKKPTIRDVAREAGVSVATVSYILNNREDQKISDATRKKVLQIVNLLNYSPNSSAQNLATNRSAQNPAAERGRCIAVCLPKDAPDLKGAEHRLLLDAFSRLLHDNGYSLLYAPAGLAEKLTAADALLCADMTREQFYEFGDKNLIPLLAYDCIVNDPVFYQISSNYADMRAAADRRYPDGQYDFVTLRPANRQLAERILAQFPEAVLLDGFTSFQRYLASRACPAATDSRVLAGLLGEAGRQVLALDGMAPQKLRRTLACIEDAVGRVAKDNHDIVVAITP